MQFNTLSGFILLCGTMLVSLAFYALLRRTTNGAREFAVFMLFGAIYVLGYGLELASLDLTSMLFWNKIQYVGIYGFPPLFLIFLLRYTGNDRWITQRNVILLFIVPVLLLGAKLTDGHFHWIYRTVTVDRSGPIPLLAFTRGPLYHLGAVYNLICVAIGMLLLWRKRNDSSALYRSQATLMAVSALAPLLVCLVYMSGFQPFPVLKHLDLNCFVYTIWGVGISWTMFRYRLFDLAPIAREALIENLSDGLVVVDTQYRIVDTNPAALQLFGWPRPPIGKTVNRQVINWIESVHRQENPQDTCVEVQFSPAGHEQYFEADVPALKDRQGRCIGYLVLLHDITERKRVEQELHELTLTDELTGLHNRRGFTMLASQYLQMAQRMDLPAIVCYLDLDDLKWINDTFGHPAGDQALVDTAAILKNTFRSADITARISGDEFVVLTIESADTSGERMLERLQQELTDFNRRSKRCYELSFSMGMARSTPAEPAPLETLLDTADQAMYAQKQEKKSTHKTAA